MMSAFLTGYLVVHRNTAMGDFSIDIWSTDYDPHEFCSGVIETFFDNEAHALDYQTAIPDTTSTIDEIEYFLERQLNG